MSEVLIPDSARASLAEADKLMLDGDYGQAHKQLSQLLSRFPESGHVNYALGTLYLHVEEFDKAIHYFSRTCQLMPLNFQAVFSLMDAFESVNSHQDVATLNEYMLANFPQQPEVIYKSAQYCSEIGNLTQARVLANRCITLCKTSNELNLLQAYCWLLLTKVDSNTHDMQTISQLLVLNKNSVKEKNNEISMIVNYAIGEVYHQLKDPRNAFLHWQLANTNQFSKATFRTKSLASFFTKLTQSDIVNEYSEPKHHNRENTNKNSELIPIFIVGLPRTGSTLLETLLSSHSLVESMGESSVISNQVAFFLQQTFNKPYPEFMQNLSENHKRGRDQDIIDKGTQIYINAVRKGQLKAPYIIDKLPANFQSIGLIKAVFPKAKIIHLTRKFEDVALSIFRHHFSSDEPYFCDIQELCEYNKMYLNLMSFWNKKYNQQIFTLRYEDLVSEPSSNIKRVLDYCGLPLEEACFETNTNERDGKLSNTVLPPIKTLSAIQVRSPISTSAIGASSAYKNLLTPLLK